MSDFKVGDVVRHRLSGERAVVFRHSAPIKGDGINLSGSVGFDFGRGHIPLTSMEYDYAITAFEVIGRIEDQQWDDIDTQLRSLGMHPTQGTPNPLYPTAHFVPDHAMPRRFRWKAPGSEREQYGLYVPDSKTPWHVQTGGPSDWNAVQDHFEYKSYITSWIDPAPENVT